MKIEFLDIPKIIDRGGRGNLSVVEKNTIPFSIKRIYYLYDVPSGATRGGHAHKEQSAILIAISGSFDVILDNGFKRQRVMLNRPNKGLLIPSMIWRELDNFSSGAICLVIASDEFNEEDYIRNYNEFKSVIINDKL
ncbi:sugar 3,4-ketoisomerase [Aestuariivivens marinum]|uniref:sugar 3,4-ketoisomerase n=1 Tax=Aestuariivivens marinum TaxID=2913555 RepID=UPI001F57F805|nr:FdtA/QdtA family cupin domain-containing protein [Aestuariivivens marinum]